ncbi:GNAT family N-acetyltransferase [Saccharomonospora piscinae]|uniref:GNAT family N-acetyltransferase n=1 Tax=Saccharomonospora piscinae TaxID=687388 RepID=A0A1V9A5J6_SACPI|nr:GNAT family protein [Saccharomonospora piscinae]OQO92415.1 GNAT family N-acetyltransferase [Saccharomonospora piscinae]TLW91870.1 GNAT family N-acetyltransferase [Saccharomonospora piscinae]
MHLSFADKPTMPGSAVVLRPVSVTDVPGLLTMLADPEVQRLTGTHRALESGREREQAEWWYATRADHDDRLDLAITARESGEYLGEVVLSELDTHNRSCAFRIALAGSRHLGRGYGTEATRLVLAHAFDTVGLHRIELEVFAFNPRAIHVYEKAGFRWEGTRRQALRWDDEWIDAYVMAVLAHEWRALP